MCSVIPFLFSALLLIRLSFPVRCVLCTVSQCWHLPWRLGFWCQSEASLTYPVINTFTRPFIPIHLFFFLLNISHNRNLFFFLFFSSSVSFCMPFFLLLSFFSFSFHTLQCAKFLVHTYPAQRRYTASPRQKPNRNSITVFHPSAK